LFSQKRVQDAFLLLFFLDGRTVDTGNGAPTHLVPMRYFGRRAFGHTPWKTRRNSRVRDSRVRDPNIIMSVVYGTVSIFDNDGGNNI
jgi:hypothetical protein